MEKITTLEHLKKAAMRGQADAASRIAELAESFENLQRPGVPVGGMEGQILAKNSAADYDTHWIDKPAGGEFISVSGELDFFSTEPVVIGAWVDGKPIYRRVVKTTLRNGANGIVNVQSWDVDTMVSMYFVASESEEGMYIPSGYYNTNFASVYIYKNTLHVTCSGISITDAQVNIILEYTKKADSTTKIFDTNEVVAGAWVDGNTIYRRVIQGTTGVSGTPKVIQNIGAWQVDKMISLTAVMQSESNYPSTVSKYPAGFMYDTGNFLSVYIEQNNLMTVHRISQYNNQPIIFILEYTKTTD